MRVVNLFSWKYGNPARVVADRMGLEPKEFGYTTVGGNSPQSLVNVTADQIQRGELDLAILTGAEAWRTRMRRPPRRRDAALGEGVRATMRPRSSDSDLTMNSPGEVERGVVMPIQVYPLFEICDSCRLRPLRRRPPRAMSASCGPGSAEVAAGNEHAWMRQPMTAEADPHARPPTTGSSVCRTRR